MYSELQAHAMVPYLGAGVGQGFEDTYALSAVSSPNPKVTKDSLDVRTFIISYHPGVLIYSCICIDGTWFARQS